MFARRDISVSLSRLHAMLIRNERRAHPKSKSCRFPNILEVTNNAYVAVYITYPRRLGHSWVKAQLYYPDANNNNNNNNKASTDS